MLSRTTHVERAAALTQKLFFQFREMNYDFQVDGVEYRDGKLIINVAKRPVGTNTKVKVMTLSLTPEGPMPQYHFTKEENMRGRCDNHTVFQVSSLDDAEHWIVDLTGPQFSIFAPCMKRDAYFDIYQTRNERVVGDGDIKVGYEAEIARGKGSHGRMLRYNMSWGVVREIEKARSDWKGTQGEVLADAIADPNNEEYERLEEEFLAFVEERMTELRRRVDLKKEFEARPSGESSFSEESLSVEEEVEWTA